MMNIGIDLGSRFIKIAEGTRFQLENTVDFYKKHIVRTGEAVSLNLDSFGIDTANAVITATGYGRNLLAFSNAETISEIKAHFYGAKRQTGEEDFTLVDIGGQDCKIIQVRQGYINDFVMNDKCAASTGRFIEQAAHILGIPMDEFMSAAENPCRLSDTCAVFCESEIVGLLAKGVKDKELAAGVNLSVARRIAPQLSRYRSAKVFASGGAAASKALLGFLGELSKIDLKTVDNTQFNGAIGCLSYRRGNG